MKRVIQGRKTTLLGGLLVLSCLYGAFATAQESRPTEASSPHSGQFEEEATLPLDDLRKFTEVFSRIKEAYVEEVSRRSERARVAELGEKTGVFTGAFAVHPVTGKTMQEHWEEFDAACQPLEVVGVIL